MHLPHAIPPGPAGHRVHCCLPAVLTHTCFPSQLLGWPLQGLQDGPPLPPGSLHWLPHNGFSSLVSKILANFCSLEHSVSFLHEGIFSLIKLPRFWKVFEMGFLYVALDS